MKDAVEGRKILMGLACIVIFLAFTRGCVESDFSARYDRCMQGTIKPLAPIMGFFCLFAQE